ncbi:MAG: hypothetical protein GY920_20215 [Aliivibrio sp.]|nr:hypothetical protein [Aliivibrio sp.]MCP4322139.1 hypothetical protein [Alteromonadales bacterium]
MKEIIPSHIFTKAHQLAEEIRLDLTFEEKEMFIYDRLIDECVAEIMGEEYGDYE